MDDGALCKNCGTAITGDLAGDPAQREECPKCGSVVREFVMNAAPGSYTFTGSDADLTHVLYPDKLLITARDLIEKGEFSISVVVAHMACEISAERSISRAFKEKGIDILEQPVEALLPGYSLANDKVKDLYNAVTGSEIQKQPFWQQFKESATRRNKAVHAGEIATKEEAEDSFKAASSLIAYLK